MKLKNCVVEKKKKLEYEMRTDDSDFEQLQVCLPS